MRGLPHRDRNHFTQGIPLPFILDMSVGAGAVVPAFVADTGGGGGVVEVGVELPSSLELPTMPVIELLLARSVPTVS